MKDCICCCIFCLGVGMVAGAVIVANNKKVSGMVQEGSKKVKETFDNVKSSIEEAKQGSGEPSPNREKSK